jgi:tetratricopeptide (TPR) repeat protein
MKGRTLAAVLTVLLLLALAGQTVRWRDRLTASRLLANAETLARAVDAGQIPRRAVADNLEPLRQAAALDPAEVGIPIARCSQYLLLSSPEPAEQTCQEALRLEPRSDAYFYLGRAQWMAGRKEEALRNFALAVRLEPGLINRLPTGASGAP